MPPKKIFRSHDALSVADRTVHSISQDMERKRELNRHHPYDHRHPHQAHHPWEQPVLPPDHDPHSLPHEEELGPHTNQPGPIRFATKITQTGRRSLISKEHKPVERR